MPQGSSVISFAQKTLVNGQINSKLHVIELGAAPGASLMPYSDPAESAHTNATPGHRRISEEFAADQKITTAALDWSMCILPCANVADLSSAHGRRLQPAIEAASTCVITSKLFDCCLLGLADCEI